MAETEGRPHPGPCEIQWTRDRDVVLEVESYAYDGDQRLLGIKRDSAPLGSVDWQDERLYDDQDLLSELVERVQGGETIDKRRDYSYFDDGRLRSEVVDNPYDGVPDAEVISTYEGPVRIDERFVPDADGDLIQRIVWTHDDRGQLLSQEFYFAPFDEPYRTILFSVDSAGRHTARHSLWSPPNPDVPDVRDTYTYSDGENLSEVLRDIGRDGSINQVLVYDYSCWAAPEQQD
jgi:hypothetical protein